MPARSSATLGPARSDESRPIRSRSRSVTHLQVQLLAAVVPAVVKQRGAPVRPDVDELPPQVIALARIPCGLRNVFDPLNRLRRETPAPDGPFLVAPGKAAQTRRRLLGPNSFPPGIRRGGRGVDHGDPAVRRAAQQLEAADPTRGPMPGLLRRFEDYAVLRGHPFADVLRCDRLRGTKRADLPRLLFARIAHVKIQEFLPRREKVARDRVGVLAVEIVLRADRDNRLWFEGPGAGQLFRPRALDVLVAALEADHEQAIAAINSCRLIRSVWVHHDERLVEAAHRLRVGDRQGAFQFPLSGAKIVAVRADRLGVPRGIVEQHHAPALDGFIPDNAGIAADALVTPLPLEHHAA